MHSQLVLASRNLCFFFFLLFSSIPTASESSPSLSDMSVAFVEVQNDLFMALRFFVIFFICFGFYYFFKISLGHSVLYFIFRIIKSALDNSFQHSHERVGERLRLLKKSQSNDVITGNLLQTPPLYEVIVSNFISSSSNRTRMKRIQNFR